MGLSKPRIDARAQQVIYLEADDDFATIRHRLSAAQAGKVILVVPPNCRGLKNRMHLRLLERLMDDSPVRVALVTRDRTLGTSARELGFPTFPSVEKAQRSRWPPRRSRLKRLLPEKGRRAPARPTSLQDPRGKVAMQRGEAVLFFGLLGGVFLILLAGFWLLVPSATVTLKPLTYPLEETLTVQADPNLEEIDFLNSVLPATVKEVEITGREQIACTAKKDVPDDYAQGEVIFINKTSEATTVISGTIVSTSAGASVRFRISEDLPLPPVGGGRARVMVEALEPGPSGNVAAWTINRVEGTIALQVNVINDSPTQGGTMKQVSYVTNEDKEQVKDMLMRRLRQEGYNALVSRLEGAYLPPESVELIVLTETYDKFVEEVADSLALDIRVWARGIAIAEEDARRLALTALESSMSEGFQLLSKEIGFRPGEVTEAGGEQVVFQIIVRGQMMMRIDEGEIKEHLTGKSIADAVAYLGRRLELVEEPSVEVLPGWWPRLPLIPLRISLVVMPQER